METKTNLYSIKRKTEVVRQEVIIDPNKIIHKITKISNDEIRSQEMKRKKMWK